jgi:putative OPT family oligopeptide transporter
MITQDRTSGESEHTPAGPAGAEPGPTSPRTQSSPEPRRGKAETEWTPVVPAGARLPELTIKALVLGLILGALMTAANTYLGLYAGMTVSASIPAAVISMGILRGILRRGTILENNIVQTIASAGESLAAGIIFTVPALVIAGIWIDFKYIPVTLIALLGGVLGVLFMIPLRRLLIVGREDLTYPEGVACAEVLEVGQKGGSGVAYVFGALGLGLIFKYLVSGWALFRHTIEGAVRAGRWTLYGGTDTSVALLGVGFIVGPNVAVLVFLGGALAWLIAIPILGLTQGWAAEGVLVDAVWDMWSTQARYIGVGAMIVGGIWSIVRIRSGLVTGFRQAFMGYSVLEEAQAEQLLRTDRDLSQRRIQPLLIATILPIFILFGALTRNGTTGLVAGIAMVVAAFFFVAVSSYVVGLVGSSNNPVSGMTISTVLFASLLLLGFGMRGGNGILAALGVAGVVCCAACTAGDVSQDLKTGYLVGATPWKQQVAQIAGVGFSALFIAPVLTLLHKAYGIGTGEAGALQAPQASLFASLVTAMFEGGGLPWVLVGAGAGLGVVLILLDERLREAGSTFRLHVMPVAVGIYLPLALSVPILLGGVLAWITRRVSRDTRRALHTGTLISSGLIAGEAVMGVIVAGLILAGRTVGEGPQLAWASALALAAVGGAIVLLARASGGGAGERGS